MSSGKWKGMSLGTNQKLSALEKIARQKDAAYIFMQLGNIPAMLSKLHMTLKMQENYSNFSKKDIPSLIDYETYKKI